MLRKKMVEDLQLKGYKERTQSSYTRSVRQFENYWHLPAEQIGEQQVRDYFLYCKNDMGWTWTDQKGQELNSRDFFWEVSERSDSVLAFRLSINENQYIEQRYVVNENKPYVVDYDVNVIGFSDYVRRGNSDFRFDPKGS